MVISRFLSRDLSEYTRYIYVHGEGLTGAGGESWHQNSVGGAISLSISLCLSHSWEKFFLEKLSKKSIKF